ncbi:MAG TPA: hypothetical protein VK427_11090, partial [Kofleriaceae bacterium]|nr:hypothetical protein [Kofleriaceae bacterium]
MASLTAQGSMLGVYYATRPVPVPYLSIRLTGEGEGQVLVTRVKDGAVLLRCSKQGSCGIDVPAGTELRLTALLGEDATFGGYQQLPMRTPKELVPYIGDPLAKCGGGDLLEVAAAGDVLDCAMTVQADTRVAAEFGLIPKEIDVAFDATPTIEELIKPLTPQPLVPIDAEQLEDKKDIVALVPPDKMPPPLPPPAVQPPPPPEQKPEQPKPVQPPPNMTMVEVKDDKNVKDKAPEDATMLSDKNRDVAEESRATETNLEKESEGKQVASKESEDTTSTEIGGPDDKISQLEETEATTEERV